MFLPILIFLSVGISLQNSIHLTDSDFDKSLENSTYALVNFHANWCIHCRNFEPTYEEVAKHIHATYPRIVLATVDGERNPVSMQKYKITKFPTVLIFKKGQYTGKEYMKERSVKALVAFIETHVKYEPTLVEDVSAINFTKESIVGIFPIPDAPDVKVFKDISFEFNEDCDFYISYQKLQNSSSKLYHTSHVKPDTRRVFNHDVFHPLFPKWVKDECRPLIRQITYENAEEITSKGLALLILFYVPTDTNSLDTYKKVIKENYELLKDKLQPVFANAMDFQHPMHHLGKTIRDAPLVVVDDFHHMYLFEKFKDLLNLTIFKKFISDFETGKLHHDFHNKPREDLVIPLHDDSHADHIQSDEKIKKSADKGKVKQIIHKKEDKTEVPSVFKKLAPNEHRYTFLRYKDEL